MAFTTFSVHRVLIGNFKHFFVKNENGRKRDAFSLFDDLLFPESEKRCAKSKKDICRL